MKVAISQPTYLPWLGYLDLIDQVDTFVFLDTVQFEKRSWQQRNRLKYPGGLLLVTIPVCVKGRFDQKIEDVEIENSHWIRKHLRSMETNYNRAPFFSQYFPTIAAILEKYSFGTKLADLNIELISWLCKALGIQTQLLRSSEMSRAGSRSELLLNLCSALEANSYISSAGSSEYLLHDITRFSKNGIAVAFQQYDHPRYHQQFQPFVSYASIVDLLFNEGGHALEIIRSGRRPVLRPADVQVCIQERIAG